jgi:hypothetical protein
MRVIKTIKFPLKKPPQSSSKPPIIDPPEKVAAKQKLDKLVKESSEVLYQIKNVFPFDLFVDEIIVTRQRIDIIYGLFFFSKEVISIEVENIFDVNLDFDPIFATIEFMMRMGQEDPEPVKFLWKKEATKMRQIVTGLIATTKQKVDLKSLSKDELVVKLVEIGKARQKESV